jgi:AcrR family transcriptional regulator
MKSADTKTKGQKTQEKIIAKALELYGRHGFANTSMQMIANACDLSQGAVMQHFPSKDRLLEACRKTVTASNHGYVDARIQATDDSLQALRKHMLYNLEWAIKHPAEADVIALTYETAIHDPDYREIAAGAVRLGTERIYRYLLAAQREKLVKASVDAETTAQVIHEYLVGLVLRTISSTQASRLTKPMEQKIDLFLKGMLAL